MKFHIIINICLYINLHIKHYNSVLKIYLGERMSNDGEKTFQEKIEENEINMEENILKANEKSSNAKIKFKEKILERKKSKNEKKLKAHIDEADASVDKALKDAESEIDMLLKEIKLEMENEEGPEDLILYKASNILEEISLRTRLKIQMAKNDLISNLQDDLEDGIEVAELEENIAELKEKTDHLIGTLEGKIATEREELKEKYGDE